MLTLLVFFTALWASGLILYPLGALALYALYRHDGGKLPFFKWLKRI